MALSHRWGVSQQILLTEATLSAFIDEIPVAKLPQSIQDAIIITRYLGVEYLWVDSLCIIQDSLDDWQAESANMRDIYKFSYCTIAASWASTNAEGCFTNRGPLQARLCRSELAGLPPQITSYKGSQGYKSTRQPKNAKPGVKRRPVRYGTFDNTKSMKELVKNEWVMVKHHSNRTFSNHKLLVGCTDLRRSLETGRQSQEIRRHSHNPIRGTIAWESNNTEQKLDGYGILANEEGFPEEEVKLVRQQNQSSLREGLVLYVKTLQKDLWAQQVPLATEHGLSRNDSYRPGFYIILKLNSSGSASPPRHAKHGQTQY